MWILDDGTCRRLLRIAPDGTRSVFPISGEDRVEGLTADRSGGMWFSGYTDAPWIGHVDTRDVPALGAPGAGPADRHRRGPRRRRVPRVRTLRAHPRRAGRHTVVPNAAPIPATKLAFDPAGGLWLASSTGSCMRRRRRWPAAPATTRRRRSGSPPRLRRTVRLARLRRGVRITVREPATIIATGDYGEDDHDSRFRLIHARRGGTYVFRLPRSALNRFGRELAAGDEPYISLYVEVTDRDGNLGRAEQDAIRVTR